jgi:FkbM family methyltransferase
MPVEYGGASIWVSPEVSLKFWGLDARKYDPALMALAKELVAPGSVVWDLGANVGLFSLAAAFSAGPGGRLLAVEADPWVARLLERSARAVPAGHAPVSVVSGAVCGRGGRVDLAISSTNRAVNHLTDVQGSPLAGAHKRILSVPSFSVDDLLLANPAPQILKIDIEGAEGLALQGAKRVLDLGPVVLCEVHDQNVGAVTEALVGGGYELFDAEESARPRTRLDLATFNTLAIPNPGLRVNSRSTR